MKQIRIVKTIRRRAPDEPDLRTPSGRQLAYWPMRRKQVRPARSLAARVCVARHVFAITGQNGTCQVERSCKIGKPTGFMGAVFPMFPACLRPTARAEWPEQSQAHPGIRL